MKEIKEPKQKNRLRTVGIPSIIPAVTTGFGVVVRLAGTTWERWYSVMDQAQYEEVLASARSTGVRDHDIHFYSASV